LILRKTSDFGGFKAAEAFCLLNSWRLTLRLSLTCATLEILGYALNAHLTFMMPQRRLFTKFWHEHLMPIQQKPPPKRATAFWHCLNFGLTEP
jgi:hypothetical protein